MRTDCIPSVSVVLASRLLGSYVWLPNRDQMFYCACQIAPTRSSRPRTLNPKHAPAQQPGAVPRSRTLNPKSTPAQQPGAAPRFHGTDPHWPARGASSRASRSCASLCVARPGAALSLQAPTLQQENGLHGLAGGACRVPLRPDMTEMRILLLAAK
jgi:hypothetical protein